MFRNNYEIIKDLEIVWLNFFVDIFYWLNYIMLVFSSKTLKLHEDQLFNWTYSEFCTDSVSWKVNSGIEIDKKLFYDFEEINKI